MMYTRNMGYGPRLRPCTCISLKRLAWAMNLPMSLTLENIIKIIPRLIESKVICNGCRDATACDDCYFNPDNKPILPETKLTSHLKKYFTPGRVTVLKKRYKPKPKSQ